ncbi:MAG: hemerythrin domain-containing protein [Gammaproteobacteria bacterium]|nr:hemerythrin domain-containing protein [Gammaproteobacteria bacterium]
MKAISIIQGEHRNLGVTLLCFETLLQDIEGRRRAPDTMLFRAIITYIDTFLYRFHHPKEDDYLFPALCRRYPAAGELINELQNDHHNGTKLCQKLGEIINLNEIADTGFAEFHQVALDYIRYERHHIGKEETELLPLAREHLSESDWEPINNAFSEHDDPMFGAKPKQRYKQLSSLITNVCIHGDVLL